MHLEAKMTLLHKNTKINLQRWLRRFPLYMVMVYGSSFALGQILFLSETQETQREAALLCDWEMGQLQDGGAAEALLEPGPYHVHQREGGDGGSHSAAQ